MREVVIISGKGGTGKTTLTASFTVLARNVVAADCDVDAADLHLLLHPNIEYREDFYSGVKASIDPTRCVQCGKCREVCRFEAIRDTFQVDPLACEGCQVCAHLCPAAAIELHENRCGEWYRSTTPYGPMVHAALGIAEENSGKLVAIVRQQAKHLAEERQAEFILIDGPPGIGCPVISSITGTDLVVVVTEPTISGLHDLGRVAELTAHFQIPTGVCVNKADLNQEMTAQIESYCRDQRLHFWGTIPYAPIMVEAVVRQIPVVEYMGLIR